MNIRALFAHVFDSMSGLIQKRLKFTKNIFLNSDLKLRYPALSVHRLITFVILVIFGQFK